MNALRDAESLLGGYAAGILTADEKAKLFAAALNHQELFDALADEEALRELLADPAARRHLLSQLEATATAESTPFWRRPTMMGLAASFFALVTTSLVLWQRERPLPAAAEHAPEAPITAAKAKDAFAKPAAAAQLQSRPQAKGQATAALPPNPTATLGAAVEEKAEAAAELRGDAKKQAAPAPSAALMEVIAADKQDASPQGFLAKEAPARAHAANTILGAATAQTLPVPICVTERLTSGRMRLTITWATGNQLYLLKRGAMGVSVLAPVTSQQNEAGATVGSFEFAPGVEEHVDLYLLAKPIPDPKFLPAEGPFSGYRKRVF